MSDEGKSSRGRPRRYSEYRLPSGRHRLPREIVAENQRWRLLGAAAEALAEEGYAGVTTGAVIERAGVSSSTFYEHFNSLPECLLAAYQMAAECLCEVILDGCQVAPPGPAKVQRGLEEALDFFSDEPAMAHLLRFEASAGVPEISAERRALIARLMGLLGQVRATQGEGRPPGSQAAEERLIGAALNLLAETASLGKRDDAPGLAAQLAQLLARSSGE